MEPKFNVELVVFGMGDLHQTFEAKKGDKVGKFVTIFNEDVALIVTKHSTVMQNVYADTTVEGGDTIIVMRNRKKKDC